MDTYYISFMYNGALCRVSRKTICFLGVNRGKAGFQESQSEGLFVRTPYKSTILHENYLVRIPKLHTTKIPRLIL